MKITYFPTLSLPFSLLPAFPIYQYVSQRLSVEVLSYIPPSIKKVITLGSDLLPLFDQSHEVNSCKLLRTPINSYRYISNIALGREVRDTTKLDQFQQGSYTSYIYIYPSYQKIGIFLISFVLDLQAQSIDLITTIYTPIYLYLSDLILPYIVI